MQSLASYGSDSEDEGTASTPAPPSADRAARPAVQPVVAKPSASPALTSTAVNRIKGAALAASSTRNSPLSGVNLHSSAPARLPPSPVTLGRSRESSASPPPYARGEAGPSAAKEGNGAAGSSQAASAGLPGGAAGVRLDSLSEFGVSPLRTGPCKPSVEAKLANFHKLRETRGLHFNDSLHASKAFRNPRIYAKLVEFVDVDETGSNWDKEVWDPKGLGIDASASRIAELQKLRSEAKSAQPAGSRSSIAFTTAPASSASRSHAEDKRYRDDRERDRDRGGERKKSRWDRGGRDRSRSPRRR
ncbi:hypothetical protein JCM10213_007541 [Rhodosporidiobolus nylandii]